ncbi:DUF421 domain-containing protein [Altererythrobacter sp.]|nr:DUF421 domain-containing protein [Altererythrobacter sp.]
MSNQSWWFSSWTELAQIAAGAAFFYVLIIALVRVLGKRTTSQMNNFDWIISIAVGSLAASGILLKNVAIADAVVAIAVLAALQYATTRLVRKSNRFSDLVKAQPTLLTHRGEFLTDAMKAERVSEEEIMAVLRSHGMRDPKDANWVILETNGEMSVIPKSDKEINDHGVMDRVAKPSNLQA